MRQVLVLTDQAEQQLAAGRVDEAVQTARRAKNLGLDVGKISQHLHGLLARGRDHEVFDRAIDVQVSRLRKLVEPDPAAPRYIQTVGGFGYVYVPEGTSGVTPTAADAA